MLLAGRLANLNDHQVFIQINPQDAARCRAAIDPGLYAIIRTQEEERLLVGR